MPLSWPPEDGASSHDDGGAGQKCALERRIFPERSSSDRFDRLATAGQGVAHGDRSHSRQHLDRLEVDLGIGGEASLEVDAEGLKAMHLTARRTTMRITKGELKTTSSL